MNPNPARDAYDLLAADYDRRWRSYIDVSLDAAMADIDMQGCQQVLDVPCGTGELERRLLAQWSHLRLTGIDCSAKMLEQAQGKDLSDRVNWIQADVAAIPSPDQSFDLVYCVNSFHFFRAPEQALAELRRVLRPDGKLVLVDWCDDYLSCKLCRIWLHWTDPAFYRTYTLQHCRSIVEQTGFEVVQAEQFRFHWIWGLMRAVCRPAQ